MPRIRRSRRVPPLKDNDYDHEIDLVDDIPSDVSSLSSEDAPGAGQAFTPLRFDADSQPTALRAETDEVSNHQSSVQAVPRDASSSTIPIVKRIPPTPAATVVADSLKVGSSITKSGGSRRSRRHDKGASNASYKSSESEIDILYQNERGVILCGIPLFSSKALGNLDPTPWTNVAHKPSPTDINTATVPDPSWEWSWPEWKVNHDEGVEKDGWEYSFMFCKKFSWHGPKWWNSFVRRRAWIRRRIRRRHREDCGNDSSNDPCVLNPAYFTVQRLSRSTPTRSSSIGSRVSRMSSVRGSMSSFGHAASKTGSQANLETISDIVDSDMLLEVLKRSRIDREKIEAVDNYLQHTDDEFAQLQGAMHEIMGLFVFQSSRQILLSRLKEMHDNISPSQEGDDSPALCKRAENLSAAISCADGEVKKLD